MTSRPAQRPAGGGGRGAAQQATALASAPSGVAAGVSSASAAGQAPRAGASAPPAPLAKQRPGRPKLTTPRSKASPSVPKRAGPAALAVSGSAGAASTVPSANAPTVPTPLQPIVTEAQSGTPVLTATNKRARAPSTPSTGGGEPQAKRQKPITGAAAAAVSAAAARNAAAAAASPSLAAGGVKDGSRAPPPHSPTSSRSRSRKPTKAKGGADSEHSVSNATGQAGGAAGGATGPASGTGASGAAPAASAAVASGTGVASSQSGLSSTQNAATRRPNPRAPAAQRSPVSAPLPSSYITVDGIPMPGNVRTTTVNRRLFGHEIQSLMHAFGDVRFCARDVLEIVEDTVRERVRFVALQAAERAVDIAEMTGVQPLLHKSLVVVTVRHVAYALRRDPRALQRLSTLLDSFQTPASGPNIDAQSRKSLRFMDASWELARELASFPDITDRKDPGQGGSMTWPERQNLGSDVFLACASRAEQALKNCMSKTQISEFLYCRSVTFVRQESRSKAPLVRAKQRFGLFREWLDLDAKEGVHVPDDALYALGQVAWETVGVLTQTALLHRYFDDIAKGFGDPRSKEWGIGRHILAALGYGVATGLMIPLTDAQGNDLRQELDRWDTTSQPVPVRWRGYGKMSSPCLLPRHIREAVRRMDKAPDLPWGYPGLRELSGIR